MISARLDKLKSVPDRVRDAFDLDVRRLYGPHASTDWYWNAEQGKFFRAGYIAAKAERMVRCGPKEGAVRG